MTWIEKLARGMALTAVAALACTGEGVIDPTASIRLPVPGAEYRGAAPHVFSSAPGGTVSMFCGTHGTFSGSTTPPATVGSTTQSRYTARFVGTLEVPDPASGGTTTHALDQTVQMEEAITLRQSSGATRTFDTELVAFDLQGGDMPALMRVRESGDHRSTGVTTVTLLSGGQSRVQTTYQVWLQISLDDGASWTAADAAVTMTLESG